MVTRGAALVERRFRATRRVGALRWCLQVAIGVDALRRMASAEHDLADEGLRRSGPFLLRTSEGEKS
jgi:hypothetical protein